MRIVDWNIEHMNSWFFPNDHPNSPALRASYPGGGFGGGNEPRVHVLNIPVDDSHNITPFLDGQRLGTIRRLTVCASAAKSAECAG